jgi:hypothetical protein
MADNDLIGSYNYDEFTADKVLPWLNFEASPPVGRPAPDFPLWHLDGRESSLGDIWSGNDYAIVEFGSFT